MISLIAVIIISTAIVAVVEFVLGLLAYKSITNEKWSIDKRASVGAALITLMIGMLFVDFRLLSFIIPSV